MTRRYYKKSLKFKLLERIRRMRSNIILRKDIQEMGSPRQISRCFKDLMEMGKLVKIGSGIYAKSYISKYSNLPLPKDGVDFTLREALRRLGVKFEPGSAEKDYNEGKSTQVPVRNIVKLKSRCRRRISFRNCKLIFEKKINAK